MQYHYLFHQDSQGEVWLEVYTNFDKAKSDLKESGHKGLILSVPYANTTNYGLVEDLTDYSADLAYSI